jgi:hypothetical protein
VRLRYRAKGGKRVSHSLRDRRLHRILQEIDDLPGRNLFTYLTPEGEACPVASHHVNAYIAEAAGIDGVSGKTFRTWAGTLAAFAAARATEGRLTMRALCRAAADTLANTPAICRASYIHPRVLDLASLPPRDRIERLAALPAHGAVRPARGGAQAPRPARGLSRTSAQVEPGSRHRDGLLRRRHREADGNPGAATVAAGLDAAIELAGEGGDELPAGAPVGRRS